MLEGYIEGKHKLWVAEMVFKPFIKLSFGAVVFLDPPSSAFFGGWVSRIILTRTCYTHSYLFWIAIFVIW